MKKMNKTDIKASALAVRKWRAAQRRSQLAGAFTLVEILIVVIILGILAAIVIPQFTNASTDARKSSLASQVQQLKSQVALYKLQHGDQGPSSTSATFWNQMTQSTKDDGTASGNNVPDSTYTHGPYFPQQLVNPLTGGSTIGALGTPTGADFTYDPTTGAVHGVVIGSDKTAYETDDGYHQLDGTAIP